MRDLILERDADLLFAIDKISLECYIEIHKECNKKDCICYCH